MKTLPVILASKSKRRAAILRQVGISFKVFESKFKEKSLNTFHEETQVSDLVMDNAKGKAEFVAKKFDNAIIIGVDTLITYKNTVFGKPKDANDATAMLKKLSDSSHKVFSGICVIKKSNGKIYKEASFDVATCFFLNLTDEEIEKYVATKEPLDKAGSYGIQEKGALLVEKVEGDYYTIVGFPLVKFVSICKKLQLEIF